CPPRPAGRRRPRLGPPRRGHAVAGVGPAAVAGGRTRGPPDARGRRLAGHVLGRQAPRRAPGRRDRGPGRPGHHLPGPSACARGRPRGPAPGPRPPRHHAGQRGADLRRSTDGRPRRRRRAGEGRRVVHVVATAGHVDHGKSTLVQALTGMDPDRLAEEKARGLTIDLGFAWTTLQSGRALAFVDVPGHVRFIKNMLAGVGAVDACLFVVAATEGWKPQSEEHLRILELLGVAHGVVALTKVGLVDEEWAEVARMDVADRVAGTFLEGAEVVAVDGVSGLGLD